MSTTSELRDPDNEEKQELKESEESERKAPTTTTTTTTTTKTGMMGGTSSSPAISSPLPHSYSSEEEENFLFPRRAKSSRQNWKNHKLSPLPDLRFEQSYRNSIAGAETVGNIITITIRDQVIVPFLQGTLWSLALLGWAHWNRVAQVSGSSLGSKFKRWWYKTNNWKLEVPLDNGGNAELAACVGDS